MATMKAIRQHEFGGPGVLRFEDVPRPEPIGTEVRVRVQAAGVNPVDFKTRSGRGPLRTLPFTVGWDVAGVVDELGGGVTRFAVGDEVLGMPWFPREAAAYAEYVTAPSRQFVRKPAGMSVAEAAALPLAGLTAWQALVDTAGVEEGQRVLIHAAAGGVGHLAVQIAKARGAHVIGTASPRNHETLTELGADELIDYRATRFEDAVRDVDVVFDLIGGDTGLRSLTVLRPGGLLIEVPSGASAEVLAAAEKEGVRATGFLVEPDAEGLAGLVGLYESGRLKVLVSKRFPLSEAAAAHEAAEHDHSIGKIILTV
ncbi:NADP-dependent oxidoreductase [Planotetraspora phitsanulokensis]|uniref:NADPH:quinone reductase n=1 Tax=Planotetraspora phitsanulokensis TaxID=575192 RepID=A0A8J3UEU2_9ACTN|nr:NADP-dependent oxidoreductase [Planotetraspora phitsanulokensis]GII37710.1 NADPH:quinone reductase [Planotetraspora phitsanulokensis]